MDAFLNDIRYAIRNLIKRPAFTLIAVITLGVGIGANTAIFSSIYALLLKPLTFPELDRVVAIWDKNPSRGSVHNEVAMANYLDWRAQTQSFENLALYSWFNANLTGGDKPERVQGFAVTANFLDVTGVKPILGRNFREEENQPGKDVSAIISYSLWQRRYGGDPNILNQTITINNFPFVIVGVMPQHFNFPKAGEIYAPLELTPEVASNRLTHQYYVIGRLKPGVSIASAQAEIDNVNGRLEKQYPETNTGLGATVFTLVDDMVRAYDKPIWITMAFVGFVLLIACANIANLMLARASGRHREIALRAALGASRWRIVRQLLTESLIVALIGGGFGVLLGFWGIDTLRWSNPGDAAKFAAGWYQLGINVPVLLFTLGISVFCGLVFGLAPALQVSKPNLNDALKDGARQVSGSSHRLRSSLVVFEVALSLVLLVGAGLSVRSFLSLVKTSPGFDPDNVMTMRLMLPWGKYKERPPVAAFYNDLLRSVKSTPGVESAAFVNYLPLGGSNSSDSYLVEGEPVPQHGQENEGRYRVATPGYFETMRIPILTGRSFTEQDKAGATRVAIVNETMAHRHWAGKDPIGKRFRIDGPLEKNPWLEIVGVVADVTHELNLPVTPEYYLPHAQDSWRSMVLVARTNVDPTSLSAALRQQVWAMDKDQPVYEVQSMNEVWSLAASMYSFSSVTLGFFAVIALLLASLGIYGVMAFAVTQRTQEIGIRIALGASTPDVLKLVVRHGMKLALLGMVIGLAGAWGLTRFMKGILIGVQPTDFLTFGVVSACLLIAALLACYLPARRATKVDPLVALRYE
ncbi:MAG TPA: ABC transporter permease [Pyrinomonadaceae bacterium]|jgi:putative ABC transport system permease protein|nr:ABC transporter permease [Pyrinomonadaceae bacterium]